LPTSTSICFFDIDIMLFYSFFFFFFSSRRRHTRFKCDWSSDVCSSDLPAEAGRFTAPRGQGPLRPPVGQLERPLHLGAREAVGRSEERRVGKECRSRWSAAH